MKNYTKLIRIKYNNKLYDVFSDENHRKVFLEVRVIDGIEKYFCIGLKDYVVLDKIYNRKDGVVYSKKTKFICKVVLSASIALSFISATKLLSNNFKLQQYNKYSNNEGIEFTTDVEIPADEVVVIESTSGNVNDDKINSDSQEVLDSKEYLYKSVNISGIEELDFYGVERVTFDDVRKTLAENKNISLEYRIYIEEFIDVVEERLPEIDLRTFNENLGKLSFQIINISDWHRFNANGYIVCSKKQTVITLKSGYKDEQTKKSVIFHELAHALRIGHFSIVNNDENIIYELYNRYEYKNTYGDYFQEGFNSIIQEYLLSDDYKNFFNQEFINDFNNGYVKTPMIYQILKLFEGKYDIYDFLNYDVFKTARALEEYSDINLLIDFYDAYMEVEDNSEIELDDESQILECEKKLLEFRIQQMKSNGYTDKQLYDYIMNYSQLSYMLDDISNSVKYGEDWKYAFSGEVESIFVDDVQKVYDKAGNVVNIVVQKEIFNPMISIYSDDSMIYKNYIYDLKDYNNPQIYLMAIEENGIVSYKFVSFVENNMCIDILDNQYYDVNKLNCVYKPINQLINITNLNLLVNLDNFVNSDICENLGRELGIENIKSR